jgi:hypothetical protein
MIGLGSIVNSVPRKPDSAYETHCPVRVIGLGGQRSPLGWLVVVPQARSTL